MSELPSTVFVVDDELSVRKATARLLQSAGLTVLAFASGHEFLEAYDPDAAGCLILDLSMPGLSGLELQKTLLDGGEPPPIIFLTGHADVSDTVQAMKGGAAEFLTKPVEDEILIGAVRCALERDAIARAERADLAEIRGRLATLTPRELQVLGYVVAGRLNKQTAAELGTVEKTIKVHRARIVEKLQVHSLPELVRLAARVGISFAPEK